RPGLGAEGSTRGGAGAHSRLLPDPALKATRGRCGLRSGGGCYPAVMHYLRLALVLVLVPGRLLSAQGGVEGEVARFRDSVEDELRGNILPFWLEHVPHPERDGFHGAVGRDGRPLERAPRAALMTSRILWTFSAAYRMYGAAEYRVMAERAARDLERNFRDQEHGGYF